MTAKVFETNQANFQQDVIQRSYQEPVIVDFWAPWCGPCRMLGPILERVANEPNSGVVLAKINSDQNPGLSAQFDVRGIPAVKAFVNGRVVDGFVGAQPEPLVRQFTQRVKTNFSPSQTQQRSTETQQTLSPQQRLLRARQYLNQGEGCKAQTLLENFPSGPGDVEAKKLHRLAKFTCSSGQSVNGGAAVQSYYNQAASAMVRRETSAALYNLLVAFNQEPQDRKDIPKQLMLAIFNLIGEKSDLSRQYMALIS